MKKRDSNVSKFWLIKSEVKIKWIFSTGSSINLSKALTELLFKKLQFFNIMNLGSSLKDFNLQKFKILFTSSILY